MNSPFKWTLGVVLKKHELSQKTGELIITLHKEVEFSDIIDRIKIHKWYEK